MHYHKMSHIKCIKGNLFAKTICTFKCLITLVLLLERINGDERIHEDGDINNVICDY